MRSRAPRSSVLAASHAGTIALCFLAVSAAAAAQVPAEFQGDWVATAANCDALLRVRIEAAKLTLVNGADTESLGGIEMAGPGYFPPGYNGIMAVAITEFSGDQPVTATFNLKEEKGAAQVEFAPVMPGAAPHSAAAALSARYTTLDLARRFPLHGVTLKRCVAHGAPEPPPARPASGAAAARGQAPASEPDACQGRERCYDAGPFVAEIVSVTGARQQFSRPWHSLSFNIRFHNKSAAPIILGYVVGTGTVIDDLGNQYGAASPPGDVKGMGRVQARSADPQFVLRPGQSRAATFVQSRVMRGTPNAGIVGTSYTFDLSIAQLEVVHDGQQVRTTREHALTFPNVGLGGVAAAAPASAPKS
jgi:hypothetical protein